MAKIHQLDTRDKPRLLFAMMQALAGENSSLSLEGNLSHTELVRFEGVSHEESGALKRGTLQPRLDFLILPLTLQNVEGIEKAIHSKVGFKGANGIIHAQIEVNGKIQFAAYDNFHRDTVIVGGDVPTDLLDELVQLRILRGYEVSEPRDSAK
jgi:hypothetical protein